MDPDGSRAAPRRDLAARVTRTGPRHPQRPPRATPLDAASRAVPVRHGDELLGALSLRKPANEPLTTTEDQLLQHLASQAGLVLRNVQLTAELQATINKLTASRRRLVETRGAERRKIERNLHDGAQQQLIAATIQLSLLEQSADDPGYFRQLAAQLKDALRAALEDLRDLARGIYPPLLADQGLAAALQAQARKTPLPVTSNQQPAAAGRRSRRPPIPTLAPWKPCRNTSPIRQRRPRHQPSARSTTAMHRVAVGSPGAALQRPRDRGRRRCRTPSSSSGRSQRAFGATEMWPRGSGALPSAG